MGKLILIWIGLPFIIKAFLFIIILYLYLMLCMQLYTRCETFINRMRKLRYDGKTEKYLELIQKSLEHIEKGAEAGDPGIEEFLAILQKRKDTYLLDLWIYYGVLRLREISSRAGSTEQSIEKKERLVRYFSEQELYKIVHYNKRRYGDLNALIMLGELRDRRAISAIEEYEEKFNQELNFYYGYNIVLAYAKLGNFKGFIKSYNISNIPNEINDDSLFVYILNCYEGNKEELINYQINALKSSKTNQGILAIKYFEINKYEEVWETVLEKLKTAIDVYSTDKSNIRVLDMAMAAIRYFQTINCKEADEYILTLVDCPIWEVRVVVLNYLTRLDKEVVEEIYIKKITDPNWHIRHNSAKALVKIGTDTEKLNKILYGDDQYAKEALEYAIEKRTGRYELG